MPEVQNSRLAELLFAEMPHCNFARTISDLDLILNRICGEQCKISWDYDDVASFDMPGTRILLSYSDSPYQGFAARLVLSVGPSGIARLEGQSVMVHTALCAKLVARLQQRCQPSEVRWRNITGIVTADEIDKLSETPRFERPRANIFNHRAGCRSQSDELRSLRKALHPYSFGADLPALSSRLAGQTIDLATSVATLPFAAAHFAASICHRAITGQAQLPR